MTPKIVPRASFHEVLAFLKGRGVVLSDQAAKMLKEKLEKEPVSKTMLEKNRTLVKNPYFKEILDHTFTKRSRDIQQIVDNNPLLQIIEQKRTTLKTGQTSEPAPMPDWLRQVFYDEARWQPFMPFLGIPASGRIVKVVETQHSDKPYIGFLKPNGDDVQIFTTRRKIGLTQLPDVKFYRLRDGVFQYEVDEIRKLEKGYLDYIMAHH